MGKTMKRTMVIHILMAAMCIAVCSGVSIPGVDMANTARAAFMYGMTLITITMGVAATSYILGVSAIDTDEGKVVTCSRSNANGPIGIIDLPGGDEAAGLIDLGSTKNVLINLAITAAFVISAYLMGFQ